VRIERAVLREVPLELCEPFDTSHGRVHVRRVLLLTLHGEGLEGWGECVAGSDPSYTGETTETAWHVLTDFVLPRVVGGEVGGAGVAATAEAVLAPVRWIRGHPMALASVEMAAWDLAARAAGVSLARALGGERARVPVGVSLGLRSSIDELAEDVARSLGEGYARVKLKIAPGRDVEVLARIRERFADATLSADANCAFTLADAPRLQELDALDLQMLEQPLAHDDLVDHARLQERLRTPICLDESIRSAADAAAALELGACRILNVKQGRVGGLLEAQRIHDLAVVQEAPVWCGGMLETGVGRAANLALAALPGFTLPGDTSASDRYFHADVTEPFVMEPDGTMAVPQGPGIGVAPLPERLAEVTVRSERLRP
jgi:O-succinylbenzoate synthase